MNVGAGDEGKSNQRNVRCDTRVDYFVTVGLFAQGLLYAATSVNWAHVQLESESWMLECFTCTVGNVHWRCLRPSIISPGLHTVVQKRPYATESFDSPGRKVEIMQ